jgi:CHASE3 domain sensor protein
MTRRAFERTAPSGRAADREDKVRLRDIGLRKKIMMVGVIPTILMAILFAGVFIGFRSILSNLHDVDRTHRTIRQTVELESNALGMVAGLRALMLTGDETFFDEYDKSREAVTNGLNHLKKTAAGD